MKRTIGIMLAISTVVFGVFVLNIMVYAINPEYREMLSTAVHSKDHDIPVVEVSEGSTVIKDNEQVTYIIDDPMIPTGAGPSTETEVTKADPEVIVIDRTYHEDCGTGKGYWVLKYSDGSVGVE